MTQVCFLCFKGLGHIVPAYNYARRMSDLVLEEKVRLIKQGEVGAGFYAPNGKIRSTIFCQLLESEIGKTLNQLRPTNDIEILARIVPDCEDNHWLFGAEASSGAWVRRVVKFYKEGFVSTEESLSENDPTGKAHYVTFADDNDIKYLYLTNRPRVDVGRPLSEWPKCILADMFVGFDGEIAAEFEDCPCWSFHPSSLPVAGMDFMRRNLTVHGVGEIDAQDMMQSSSTSTLIAAEIKRRPYRQGIIINDVDSWYSYDQIRHVEKSNLNIRNDFLEFEIDKEKVEGMREDPWKVLCVGPLFLSTLSLADDLPLRTDLDKWLDSTLDDPLIYITMGSQFNLSKSQVSSLCDFLRKLVKRDPFLKILWANRTGIPDTETLPDAVKILPWVDQLRVFRAPNLQAVITHGGWNGLLEAMTLTRARLYCVPLGAEQGINSICVERLFRNGLAIKRQRDHALLTDQMFEDIQRFVTNQSPNPSSTQSPFSYNSGVQKKCRSQKGVIPMHLGTTCQTYGDASSGLRSLALQAFENSSKRNVYTFLDTLM